MVPAPVSVLGIDLSLQATGMASVVGLGGEGPGIETRVVKPTTRGHRRFQYIVRKVILVASQHDLVGLEAPAYRMSNQGTHALAGLWWAVRQGLWEADIPVAEISPSTRAKYAVGKGGGPDAAKPRVHAAARGLWPAVPLKTHDEADALLLAAIAARVAGVPFDPQPAPERFAPVNGIKIALEHP